MYFYVDCSTQQITAFKTLGQAARAAYFAITGQYIPEDTDPLQSANAIMGDAAILLNMAAAFEAVDLNEGVVAYELAPEFKNANNAFFCRKEAS